MATSTADSNQVRATLRSRWWVVHVIWAFASTVLLVVVTAAAFLLGGILGQSQLYESWRLRKIEKLSTILDAEEFRRLNIESSSAAQVYLTGNVDDAATLDSLRAQVISAFGSDEAQEMVWRIDTEQ